MSRHADAEPRDEAARDDPLPPLYVPYDLAQRSAAVHGATSTGPEPTADAATQESQRVRNAKRDAAQVAARGGTRFCILRVRVVRC